MVWGVRITHQARNLGQIFEFFCRNLATHPEKRQGNGNGEI